MPDADGSWRLAAPAKLNLWLQVVGRRSDGFHELDTLMVLLELSDALEVHPEGPELEVCGPEAEGVPTDRANLAWRGWEAGWAGALPSGALRLVKLVPAASGLGGGSSDAAAGWRLARHVAGAPDEAPDRASLEILAAVGADVPFFAAQVAAARVGGVGERIVPADAPAATEVVLVHPPFGLSTAAVFAELTPADWSTHDEGPGPGRNDLLAPALRLRPDLGEVLRLVAGTGEQPHLTGSGPTVFVVTDDPDRADWVAERLRLVRGLTARRTRLRSEPASIEPS
jgi:4-diphosphocytidyl-2-C-methyl-D-erythritol kinase